MNRARWLVWLSAAAIIVSWLAAVACGEWVDVPTVRKSGYQGVIGEIEDRMPAASKFAGNKNRCLWAHKGTHALNGELVGSRILSSSLSGGFVQQTMTTTGASAFYLPGGRALKVPGPQSVRLSHVAAATSVNKRGPAFQQLLGRLLGDNDHVPLILFDELSAYICGLVAGLETGDRRIEIVQDYNWTVEIHGHCRTLTGLLQRAGYSHSDELVEFLTVTGRYLNELRPYVARAK